MQFLTMGQIANHPYQKEYRYPIALTVFGFIVTGAVCVASAIGASRVWTDGPVGVVLLGFAFKQQKEILLELLATGDRIGALRAARHLYGFDATRAVQVLEELSPTRPKKDD